MNGPEMTNVKKKNSNEKTNGLIYEQKINEKNNVTQQQTPTTDLQLGAGSYIHICLLRLEFETRMVYFSYLMLLVKHR